MPNANDFDEQTIVNLIKELNEKMQSFSSILEKFGLDIITKMGQTNLKVNMLTDKVNELHKATLDIKSLSPQLNNIIENQNNLENELDLIKSLIVNLRTISPKSELASNEIHRDEAATDKKETIIENLSSLKQDLTTLDDPQVVKLTLEKIKEDIFDFTGGHRICNEILKITNRLNTTKSLSAKLDQNNPKSETIEDHLNEKITFWINKLMVKDKKVI
ncbi:MAG: hypothetical protein ACFFBZ_09770 [Promethearchaeota archaeon]